MKPLLRAFILNDLRRNKAINTALFLFLLLSALLMSTGVLVIGRLSGAIEQIMAIAQPPHFMQMHIGDFNREAIHDFAQKTPGVKATQITDMVNIEGANLTFTRQDGTSVTLSDSLLDNYFIAQNPSFDFLLDLDNQIVHLQPGQVGLPISYAKARQLSVGDSLTLQSGDYSATLTVSHLLRDAQMGSSLASSIRFLLHDEDFKALNAQALRREVIIGFRLQDPTKISEFEAKYLSDAAAMPKNGVAITLPLIQLMNGLGDGLMSGIIILVSGALIGIALMNLRFTILATLEEEVREIGTLRAIGLTPKDIRHLYRSKYAFLAGAACLLGALLAFPLSTRFTQSIALNFGLAAPSLITLLAPLLAALIVFIVVLLRVSRILKDIARLTIVHALVEGQLPGPRKKRQRRGMPKLHFPLNSMGLALSWHSLRTNPRPWLLLMTVYFVATLMLLIPLNMYMTMNSKDFIQYMGAAKSDVRLAIADYPGISRDLQGLEATLAAEKNVTRWHRLSTLKSKVAGPNGLMRFQVESGDFKAFPIAVDNGRLPTAPGEIALSAMNAQRLEAALGSTITLYLDDLATVATDVPHDFKVVGIYQDITNGGMTAKISDFKGAPTEQYVYFVDVADTVGTYGDADSSTSLQNQLVAQWSKAFPTAKVIPVETLMAQTLGTITSSLRVAVVALVIVVAAVLSLVTVLFFTLRMQKQQHEDAILLATGFSGKAIQANYLIQGLLTIAISVALAAMASLFLGEGLVSVLLMALSFGLTHMTFLIQPLAFIAVGLLLPLGLGLSLIWITTQKTKEHIHAITRS